jgi:quercetin dioxygenase-like cupin family protein
MSHVIRAATMNRADDSLGVATPTLGASESIVCSVKSPAGWRGKPHSHDREEIIVVLAGSGVVTLDGAPHDFTAGDAIVISAGTVHGMQAGADGMECITVEPVGIRFFDPDGNEHAIPPLMR